MNIVLYLTSVVTIANFLLSIGILLRAKRKIENVVFAFLLLSVSLWSWGILSFFYEYLSFYRDIWVKLTHVSGITVSFLFVLFVSIHKFSWVKNKLFHFILFIPVLFNYYYILFTNKIVGHVQRIEYEIGDLYLLYAFNIIIYFLFGFIILLLKILTVTQIEDKKLFGIILIGSFFATIPVLIFDLIFPYFKIYNYTWFGPLFIYFWIIFVFLAINKFIFLNIKIISTEYFILLLWSSIILRLFLTKNINEIVVNFITLIILIPVNIMLINSVIREVEQREKLEQLNRIKSEFLSFAY